MVDASNEKVTRGRKRECVNRSREANQDFAVFQEHFITLADGDLAARLSIRSGSRQVIDRFEGFVAALSFTLPVTVSCHESLQRNVNSPFVPLAPLSISILINFVSTIDKINYVFWIIRSER